jgi:hypothetical protein
MIQVAASATSVNSAERQSQCNFQENPDIVLDWTIRKKIPNIQKGQRIYYEYRKSAEILPKTLEMKHLFKFRI